MNQTVASANHSFFRLIPARFTSMIASEIVNDQFMVQVASESHLSFAETICDEMAESARARGTGIAKRSPIYVMEKMLEGKAIIATTLDGTWVGFCYIETWEHGKYVANSGLIVRPEYRKSGIATRIKAKAFELSRKKFPEAKIIGITTSLAVMKINSDLGYQPVTLNELTHDEAFWKGCQTCTNFDILTRTERKHCLCTGMMYDPEEHKKQEEKPEKWNFVKESGLYSRWMRIKERILLRLHADRRPANPTENSKRRRLLPTDSYQTSRAASARLVWYV